MKNTLACLMVVSAVALMGTAPALQAGTPKRASSPIIIPRPAIPTGSNFSRAPFPAWRLHNDVTPPNGQAVDLNLAPNTPSTTPEPLPQPPPVVAILQPDRAPGLTPTGRPTVGAAVALDSTRMQATIQNSSFESRDQLIDDVRVRMIGTQEAMMDYRRSTDEMSPEGRTQFAAAADEVRSREKALEKSLRAAGRASADSWEAARARVASDYAAYADSLARVDALAGLAPTAVTVPVSR